MLEVNAENNMNALLNVKTTPKYTSNIPKNNDKFVSDFEVRFFKHSNVIYHDEGDKVYFTVYLYNTKEDRYALLTDPGFPSSFFVKIVITGDVLPADYNLQPDYLTFDKHELLSFYITIQKDTEKELTEKLTLSIADYTLINKHLNIQAPISPTSYTTDFYIKGDYSTIGITSVTDGKEGESSVEFNVQVLDETYNPLAPGTLPNITIHYTIDGTAIGGTNEDVTSTKNSVDYNNSVLNGVAEIDGTNNFVTIVIPVFEDLEIEKVETVTLTINSFTVPRTGLDIAPISTPSKITKEAKILDNDVPKFTTKYEVRIEKVSTVKKNITEGDTVYFRAFIFNNEENRNARTSDDEIPTNFILMYGIEGDVTSSDYENSFLNNLLTFTSDKVQQVFSVTTLKDTINEPIEDLTVSLNEIYNASKDIIISTSQNKTIVKINPSNPYHLAITSVVNSKEGGEPIRFNIQVLDELNAPLPQGTLSDFSVNYTIGGTAIGGITEDKKSTSNSIDYNNAGLTGNALISGATNLGIIEIPVFEDSEIEKRETVSLMVNSFTNLEKGRYIIPLTPSNLISKAYIDDNDARIFASKYELRIERISPAKTNVNEGDTLEYRIFIFNNYENRDALTTDIDLPTGFFISYDILGVTASDYLSNSFKYFHFKDNSLEKTFTVNLLKDSDTELEDLTVALNKFDAIGNLFPNTLISNTEKSDTITINPSAVTYRIGVFSRDGQEGGKYMKFEIRVLDSSNNPITPGLMPNIPVKYTIGGTAVGGSTEGRRTEINSIDYDNTGLTGSAVIDGSTNLGTIVIPIFEDMETELNETISLTINSFTNPNNGTYFEPLSVPSTLTKVGRIEDNEYDFIFNNPKKIAGPVSNQGQRYGIGVIPKTFPKYSFSPLGISKGFNHNTAPISEAKFRNITYLSLDTSTPLFPRKKKMTDYYYLVFYSMNSIHKEK